MVYSNKVAGLSLLVALVLAVSGCVAQEAGALQEPARQQIVEKAGFEEKNVMHVFNVLVEGKANSVAEIISYINNNIALMSPANASLMLIGLEQVQKKSLPALQARFEHEAVQQILIKTCRNGYAGITDKFVTDLLAETTAGGFKVEMSEGMFFPVIDYELYQKYRGAVTGDMAAFIDIMAIESAKPPAEDAGIVIGWDEVLNRALRQERFLRDYSYSAKAEDIRQLLKNYAAFAFYGANNSPLFSYTTKQMMPEAKKAYLRTAFELNNGKFSQAMSGYLTVLKENDYKLTAEVQTYRNSAYQGIP